MATPSPDLVFSQEPSTGSPTALVFGAEGDTGVRPPVEVTVYALMGGITVTASAIYDNRVINWLDCRASAPHQPAEPVSPQTRTGWGLSESMRRGTAMPWGTAVPVAVEQRAVHRTSLPRQVTASTHWQTGVHRAQAASAGHQRADNRVAEAMATWQVALRLSVQAMSGMQAAVQHDTTRRAIWQTAGPVSQSFSAPAGASMRLRGVEWATAPWQVAQPAPNGRSSLPPVVLPPGVAPWSSDLVFQCPPVSGSPTALVFGALPCYGPEAPAATLYILPARTYMAVHSLIAHRLPDLTEVPLYAGTKISADAGSFGWSLSASGPEGLFDLLRPEAGVPQQLRVVLDGITWVFAIQPPAQSFAFGKRAASITGQSVTALLAAPWQRETQYDNAAAATAQQLAAQALDLTGVALDWGITDWLVPAHAWSRTGTPLSAVQAIAEAVGGYLQSHRSDPTLQVRHPYPVLADGSPGGPWNWHLGAADIELAPDAVILGGMSGGSYADINGVYVTGTTQGVNAFVRRAGTQGDKLAAQQTDPLIVHQDAAMQRGLAVLGKGGTRYDVSLELPILTGANQPGVIDVGHLVQVNDPTPWRGRVRSVSVSHDWPKARQTIVLERHLS